MSRRGRILFFVVALTLGFWGSQEADALIVRNIDATGWGVWQGEGMPIQTALNQGDLIVFIANQGWLSRIYVLNSQGAVLRYFEYEYYIFSDLEIVDNELYAR